MPPASSNRSRNLAAVLRRWYRRHGRDLPWRNTTDPYRIWLSEVMLQQTQVSRVIGYYERFLKKLPTVQSLARAPWRTVLPLWRGLGYYHRARNLQRAASMIVQEHGGMLPSGHRELRALPGIGEYTANAIRSFAFGHPVLALDTNITRVLSRCFGVTAKQLPGIAPQLLAAAPRSSSLLNHALMDVGALFCLAQNPRCESCPLVAHCASSFNVTAQRRATRPKPRDLMRQDVVAACIHRNGLYLVAKRAKSRGGAWEFPGGKREAGESLRAALKREIREELGIEVSVRPPFHQLDVELRSGAYRIHFSRCQILRGIPTPHEHAELRWVEPRALTTIDLAETNRTAAGLLQSKK